MASVVVASHNLMRGSRLDALAAHHRDLKRRVGLDVLCVQEARRDACGTLHGRRLAAALGDWADVVGGDPVHGVAVLFDRTRLRLVRHETFRLPRHEDMSLFERRVLLDDRPLQIEALLAVFEAEGGATFAAIDFHLDTVGGTPHRRAQVASIASRIRRDGLSRVVACGDTNAFDFGRRRQRSALRTILDPLRALGVRDTGGEWDTHWFARQDEPGLLHAMVRGLARRGLEVPGRFDVVCTDLPAETRGRVETPESDHDLVWARLSLD